MMNDTIVINHGNAHASKQFFVDSIKAEQIDDQFMKQHQVDQHVLKYDDVVVIIDEQHDTHS